MAKYRFVFTIDGEQFEERVSFPKKPTEEAVLTRIKSLMKNKNAEVKIISIEQIQKRIGEYNES